MGGIGTGYLRVDNTTLGENLTIPDLSTNLKVPASHLGKAEFKLGATVHAFHSRGPLQQCDVFRDSRILIIEDTSYCY